MKKNLQNISILILAIFFIALSSINAQALTGTKIIGSGGDYASLSAAIADLNTKGVSGKLTFLINENLVETGSLEITTTSLTGTNSLLIKPNVGKSPIVSFSSVATSGSKGNSGIVVSGTSTNVGFITFDGSNTENGTSRDMTFELNDGTNGRYVFRFNGETDNITIKNLNILATAIMSTTSSGTRTYGIYAASSSTLAADNFTVTNCQIGSANSSFYYALYKPDGGTYPYGADLEISKNNIYAQHKGFSVWGCDGSSNFFNNDITIVGHPTGAYVQNSINGIYVESWKGTVNIYNNKISSLNAKALNQTATKALYGILVYYASGSGIIGQTANIFNNFISNFNYVGDVSTNSSEIIGLAIDALDQTVNVFYNTVYMTNNSTNPIYGIRIYDDPGQSVALKNNIIINSVDIANSYAIYLDKVTNGCLKESNYNDLFVVASNASVGYYDGAAKKTLADWKTASGKDANSISLNPVNPFGGNGNLKSITDLHWVSAPAADYKGTPISGFDKDIDGDTRHSATPTIGADEFNPLTNISEENNIYSTEFHLSQNYPNPFNPSTKINFTIKKESNVTLKIYDMLGREVATLVNDRLSSGQHNVIFNASNLSSGVYFYRLKADSFVETKRMLLIK